MSSAEGAPWGQTSTPCPVNLLHLHTGRSASAHCATHGDGVVSVCQEKLVRRRVASSFTNKVTSEPALDPEEEGDGHNQQNCLAGSLGSLG